MNLKRLTILTVLLTSLCCWNSSAQSGQGGGIGNGNGNNPPPPVPPPPPGLPIDGLVPAAVFVGLYLGIRKKLQ